MKCPTCESCEYAQYCGATEIMRKCERHHKKVEQTNEEWFCGLSTEEKAKWLTNSGFLTCTLRDCEDCKYYDKNNDDCIDGYEASHDTQMWVEWLKQPHTDKE